MTSILHLQSKQNRNRESWLHSTNGKHDQMPICQICLARKDAFVLLHFPEDPQGRLELIGGKVPACGLCSDCTPLLPNGACPWCRNREVMANPYCFEEEANKCGHIFVERLADVNEERKYRAVFCGSRKQPDQDFCHQHDRDSPSMEHEQNARVQVAAQAAMLQQQASQLRQQQALLEQLQAQVRASPGQGDMTGASSSSEASVIQDVMSEMIVANATMSISAQKSLLRRFKRKYPNADEAQFLTRLREGVASFADMMLASNAMDDL